MKLLLRAYPRRWRDRYGDELLALLEAEPLTWRVRANVVAAGLAERARGTGPAELRVLWSWSFFVVGGMAFQKTSEHWQGVVPVAYRDIPTIAFDTVVAVAVIGSVAVLTGVLLVLPAFLRDLRRGGWTALRRAIVAAALGTGIAAAALVALSVEHDVFSGTIFVAFALFSLFAWTHAASAAAARLAPSRLHTHLALVVTASMCVMTLAAAAWFAAVTPHAPSFVGAAQLAVVATFMLVPTGFAASSCLTTAKERTRS